jgi:hypothetical protein
MSKYLATLLLISLCACKTAVSNMENIINSQTPPDSERVEKIFEIKSIGKTFGTFDSTASQMVRHDIFVNSYSSPQDRRHLVIVGGVHGGYEWNSVALADDILQYAKSDPSIIPEGISLHIITCLNVDGYKKIFSTTERVDDAIGNEKIALQLDLDKGRFNGRNVDLNRNFFYYGTKETKGRLKNKEVFAGAFHFSEPETVALRDFVKSLPRKSPLDHNVDIVFLHSAVTGGAIIPPQVNWWNGLSEKQFPDDRSDVLAAIFQPKTNYRNSNQIFSLTTPTATTNGAYSIKGDAAVYFAGILKIPGITIELPVKDYPIDEILGINVIKRDNIEAIKALLINISEQN